MSGSTLNLDVLDDGIGIPPEEDRVTGMGLRSMKYRTRILHGRSMWRRLPVVERA